MPPYAKQQLSEIADSLVHVSGTLMGIACQDEIEHTENCKCQICLAFISVQNAITSLERLIKET